LAAQRLPRTNFLVQREIRGTHHNHQVVLAVVHLLHLQPVSRHLPQHLTVVEAFEVLPQQQDSLA
jgi:hypothetical protein